MGEQIQLGELTIEVVFKDIKNLHLSVHPPAGRVSISAPRRMSMDAIRGFAISKLAWIRQQQTKICAQEREPEREYIDRESHYLWGRRYLLSVVERDEPPAIEIRHNKLILGIRPGTDAAKRATLLEAWYREQVKLAVPPLVAKWELELDVKVARFFVQRMRTRWGSCNPEARNLRFNTDLAKKPRECLEYIVVHEMVHLLEPTHNRRFVALMDRFMPTWKQHKQALNRLPVRHEDWEY
ncbi:M48 family metallopeptidase [Chloracidobacterium validum]|uniref:M48 family metallopeptidase n=1 Tax=Chloracidobacterium validum TaxID=2821543 RepID=A0ABX8B9T7_9BACT|nr:SprT family zinc-dependent metalloprotease [Chloracidobacterium validum]QUW02315.1 M48 family metallopeptidase [Chloracidobacterium validum]